MTKPSSSTSFLMDLSSVTGEALMSRLGAGTTLASAWLAVSDNQIFLVESPPPLPLSLHAVYIKAVNEKFSEKAPNSD